MKKTNIAILVNSFYERHKEQLENAYPGLTPSKIESLLLEWEKKYHCHLFAQKNYIRENDTFFSSLLKGVPLEHILQEKFFYQHSFFVNEDVLIPRNETELLVEEAVKVLASKNKNSYKVLDIGTGSACIGLSLALELDFPGELHLVDIDDKALGVAKKNVFLKKFALNPELQVHCYQSDLLKQVKEKSFDLIVSNPPYIKSRADFSKVHWQVAKYEPSGALFIDDEQYFSWFSRFIKEAISHLVENGIFIMEGHEDHLAELLELAKSMGLGRVELLKDYSNRERFLKVSTR